MDFSNLDVELQEQIISALNSHLEISADIIKKERYLLPMLLIPESKQLIGLQSKDGVQDVDKAYEKAVELLKSESFSCALFSYSTRIGLADGGETDALKTCVFTADGLAVSFFTPYSIKGFLKKSIVIEKTIFSEINENIFNN